MNDAHHPFDLLGRNGTCPALFSEEVHYMSGKFITCLWRKKRLRHGFVLSHKDTSCWGKAALGAGGPLTCPCPLHMWPPCLGDLQLCWGSQGSPVTRALLPLCSSLSPFPGRPRREEQSDQPLCQLLAGAGCEGAPRTPQPGRQYPEPWVPPAAPRDLRPF